MPTGYGRIHPIFLRLFILIRRNAQREIQCNYLIIRCKTLHLLVIRQLQAYNLPRISQLLDLFAIKLEINAARIAD